jgi:hypothetical protein
MAGAIHDRPARLERLRAKGKHSARGHFRMGAET